MNRSRWYKHFHLVCLFISILLRGSFAMTAGEEPTEEPEESNIASTIVEPKINESFSDRHNQSHHARALFHSSGDAWKTASRFLGRGIRMFRESLHEGAIVAHMFKEDMDEGVTSIMRQNRGVKTDGQTQNENSNSGSIFDSQMLREGVLGSVLRFMGINSKQMGVIALNVLIIFAEWITSSVIGSTEVPGVTSRMIKTNLIEWVSTGHNQQLEKIITQAKSPSLPEKLIDTLSQKTGDSTSCVQLLICKMTPVIRGFQDTVKDEVGPSGLPKETGWKTASKIHTNSTVETESEGRGFFATSQHLLDKFLGHLPPKERMLDFGDRCEKKFPQCQLLKFTKN